MSTVLQSRLDFAPWADPATRRLPGTIPVTPADWLRVDDAYAGQMALRDRLIADQPEAVLALDERASPAARELLEMILPLLPALGHRVADGSVTRPDGVTVPLDRDVPMATLGRLTAEDLCLMDRREGSEEHLLVAAALCFPAGWTLAQKFLRPMIRIHQPVARYDEDVARRVQRLLDGVQPGRGLMRGTAHWASSGLHHPLTEERKAIPPGETPFIRVERQCLFRLPESRAVVFSIHTSMIHPDALSPEQAALLEEFPIRRSS
ncbi:heme-dependent oxidative N-demethylase family protein [Paracoccus zhejiangensis]|uniref:DUF3445 domain-containing protein n=1 Tax=Paracoccus zhejiangensis TaxID=1077935 RepID=A0A2H5EYH3_9RHOB|nr:DUF3445 domain-containing protein [Paracoccus zhejiangensis]AUH64324.1 hypothetical protein CX676_09270 [Paracoccus zhejiangensis]